jgi:alginate O-acetyltransferase complex protein AlgI
MFGQSGEADSSAILTGYLLRPANFAYLALCVGICWGMPRTAEFLEKTTPWKVIAGLGLFVYSLALMFTQGFNPFLYFQF